MDKNIEDLFRYVSIYKPLSVGVEVSGQQGGFIQWLKKEMISKNTFFNLASDNNGNKEGIRPNTNKLVRFNVVLPLFKMKKIWFPTELRESTELREAMDELRNASGSGFKSKHDDFIDTVSMLGVLSPYKPTREEEYVYDEYNARWKVDEEEENTGSSYIF